MQADLLEVPIVFAAAMSCIMGNRLLLNIRQSIRDRDGMVMPSPHPASADVRIEVVEMNDWDSFGR